MDFICEYCASFEDKCGQQLLFKPNLADMNAVDIIF